MILTKRPGADDDVSDADAEDITSLYKNPDGMSRYQKHGDGCFNSHFSILISNDYYFYYQPNSDFIL
jgi:transglutaminase 1